MAGNGPDNSRPQSDGVPGMEPDGVIDSNWEEVVTSFDDMGLKEELLRGIYAYGFEKPSAIQQRAIIPCIKGHDVIAQAQSGTGKTATFSISILQQIDTSMNECQALILAPTRELAQQIQKVVLSLGDYMHAQCHACIGGTSVRADISKLEMGTHIVAGTPGRVSDMIARRALRTDHIKIFVLDEADEMLSRGFKDQIYDVFKRLETDVQVILLSATMPQDVLEVTKKFMRDPVRILVKKEELTLEGIKQFFVYIEREEWKFETLCPDSPNNRKKQQQGFRKIKQVHHMDIDKELLAAPIKSAKDKFALIPEFLKVRGLVKQHLDSFNYFVNTGIKKIVRANDRIVSGVDPSIWLRFNNVYIDRPSLTTDGVTTEIAPHTCRLSDMTYSAPIRVDVEYVEGSHDQKMIATRKGIEIGRLPIMLRSCCCTLYGKTESELATLGECPLDPGGYFIIKGNEKVLLIQEQLSKNRIIIDMDKKGNVNASVTSSSETIKSKTIIQMEKQKIYLELNQFSKKIPIMVVMKAMGMTSDQEVVQMVGRDTRYGALLMPSIEECAKEGIYTKEQALLYLEPKVKRSMFDSASSDKDSKVMAVLRDIFIANVPVRRSNFRPKCIYVAVMLRRIMDAILNKDAMDDKDYVGNKRLELSGQSISLLFEDLFKTMISEVRKTVDNILTKPSRSSRFDLAQYIRKDQISLGLERTLSTGNFDLKRFKMHRTGMTQVLARLSFIGSLGQMTRTKPQFEKSRKVSGPRALQPSQWGMLCPCDTPEGEACGLVKNLALMAHVTTDEEEGPLISLCKCLGVEDLETLSAEELHSPNSFLVLFNGDILGKHRKPQRLATAMRKLRRAGKIGEFVSVFVNEKQHCVYIASDGGRVCRPLVIADKGISRVKEYHMQELNAGVRTFDDFLSDGLIEYLDVNEQNNALIALYEDDATTETTHIEIEPFTILGVIAGLIPYPHHNQSPRNTYQCAMGKQAMGNIAYNQLRRIDLLYLLVYPQRPLLTTKTIELVGFDKLGAGQNATVAVMSYSGYDIEDAIVMNKSSLDRGFGRCILMKKFVVANQNYSNNTQDRIIKPNKDEVDSGKMRVLDDDGIAAPGEIITANDIYVKKQVPIVTRGAIRSGLKDSDYRSTFQRYKGPDGESCVVDKVALFSDKHNNLCVKLLIRHTRRPEVGDKFSSRHGQKGVCGTIVQQEDFPFSERGICPDLIMNPHGFPSRMTVGKMIELLGGKAGVSCGRFHYGSAFGEPSGHADKVEAISETLVRMGFSYDGKDYICSGITGCPLQAYIFMGPIYYQKLKHMVLDKMHARGSGPRVSLTRQPTEGKARNGGLRVGEMERDCLIAYGASMLLYERLMISSDPFEVQVCRVCGLLGYYNHKMKAGICSSCKNGDNISTMKLPYACKLLIQELQSMNIVPRLKLAEA